MVKTVGTNKARQGRRGYQVLVILVCALVLALIVWWGVGIYGGAIAPEDPVGGAPTEQPAEVAPGAEATDPAVSPEPAPAQ
jgi:hypothetical protein